METSNKSHVWYCQTTSNSCASLHIQAEGAQAKPATSLMSHAVKPLATHALLYTSRLKDHKLNFNWVFSPGVLIALDYLAMIGTSDRPCWLAESCNILLLLLLAWKPHCGPVCRREQQGGSHVRSSCCPLLSNSSKVKDHKLCNHRNMGYRGVRP